MFLRNCVPNVIQIGSCRDLLHAGTHLKMDNAAKYALTHCQQTCLKIEINITYVNVVKILNIIYAICRQIKVKKM